MNGRSGRCVGRNIRGLRRHDKGLVKRYMEKVTGLSRAHVTRLIAQYVATGVVQSRKAADGASRPATHTTIWPCWRKWIWRTER